MQQIKYLLLAIGMTTSTPAYAVTTYMGSGNDVLLLCDSDQALKSCVAYIAGIADAITAQEEICLPEHTVIGQLVDVALNYLRAHPAQRQMSGAYLIRAAMMQAFPCCRLSR